MTDANITGDSTDTDEIYRTLSSYCGGIAVFICAFGLFGNSLSIYVFSRSLRGRHGQSINLLLTGLSFSDLCLCTVAVPVLYFRTFISKTAQNEPTLQFLVVYHNIIIFGGPILMAFQYMSVWFLVLITVERYLAVCKPLLARVHCRKRRTAMVMISVVLIIIAYITPKFWNYKQIYSYNGSGMYKVELEQLLLSYHAYRLWYLAFIYFIAIFTIPFGVLSVLSAKIIKTIFHAQVIRRSLTDQEIVEHDTTRMLLAVVTVFIVCYIPSALLNFVEAFNVHLFSGGPKGNLFNDFSNILVTFNSASTVFLYIRFCRRYRQTSLDLFYRICSPYKRIPLEDTAHLTPYYNCRSARTTSNNKNPLLIRQVTLPAKKSSEMLETNTNSRVVIRRVESTPMVRVQRKYTVSDTLVQDRHIPLPRLLSCTQLSSAAVHVQV